MRECVQFSVRADIEQAARSVIGARCECIAIGEESNYRLDRDEITICRFTHCTALISDS